MSRPVCKAESEYIAWLREIQGLKGYRRVTRPGDRFWKRMANRARRRFYKQEVGEANES